MGIGAEIAAFGLFFEPFGALRAPPKALFEAHSWSKEAAHMSAMAASNKRMPRKQSSF